jgi:hypothetical protein
MIGRIAVPQAPIELANEAVVKVEGGKRDRAASPDYLVVNGTRYDKRVKVEKEELVPLKEVDGVIEID